MKRCSFILCTMLLIVVIVLCISSTVKGQNNKRLNKENEYISNIEDKYIDEIKSEMSNMGFEYAGVSLTKTVDNEVYTYTLQIHHKKLDGLCGEERRDILDKLSRVKLGTGGYAVKTKILEYNC